MDCLVSMFTFMWVLNNLKHGKPQSGYSNTSCQNQEVEETRLIASCGSILNFALLFLRISNVLSNRTRPLRRQLIILTRPSRYLSSSWELDCNWFKVSCSSEWFKKLIYSLRYYINRYTNSWERLRTVYSEWNLAFLMEEISTLVTFLSITLEVSDLMS